MESSKDPSLSLPLTWCSACLLLTDLPSVLSPFSLGSSFSSHSTSSGSYFIVWGKTFLSFCHGICPASQFSCYLSTTHSTFWPCLLFLIFFSFNLSSPVPVLAPSALVWFALRSQLPNLMHSSAFRKFQPCVSEKYSGWMLYFSCKATASLHTNSCANGDMWILIT